MWGTALAASSRSTVTRTISEPARARSAHWRAVASMSAVSVLVIDCTTIGASPPIVTPPTFTGIELRRGSCELVIAWPSLFACQILPRLRDVRASRSFSDHSAKHSPQRPLSPRGRGREAMTYGREHCAEDTCALDGATVSHSAELVRGDFISQGREGPLIRPSC